jgi:hypothetical protein
MSPSSELEVEQSVRDRLYGTPTQVTVTPAPRRARPQRQDSVAWFRAQLVGEHNAPPLREFALLPSAA